MSFGGQASWAKMMSPGGQASNTCMPPDKKSKQSWVTYLSLKHCEFKLLGLKPLELVFFYKIYVFIFA
jgi:hypothetical protein